MIHLINFKSASVMVLDIQSYQYQLVKVERDHSSTSLTRCVFNNIIFQCESCKLLFLLSIYLYNLNKLPPVYWVIDYPHPPPHTYPHLHTHTHTHTYTHIHKYIHTHTQMHTHTHTHPHSHTHINIHKNIHTNNLYEINFVFGSSFSIFIHPSIPLSKYPSIFFF